MPSPEELFEELEEDRATREREIRLLGNAARLSKIPAEKETLNRTSVVMTYAHLEGFCRFALGAYVTVINSMKLACCDASHALVAATLSKVFGALRNTSSKHPVFSKLLPDDAKLHLVAREQEFIAKFESIVSTEIEIPESAIDLESNLNALVLKKNLYKLGLNYLDVDKQKADLDKLLGIRNAIAHGDKLKVPESKEVDDYVRLTFQMMGQVQNEIFEALVQKRYLRSDTPFETSSAPSAETIS